MIFFEEINTNIKPFSSLQSSQNCLKLLVNFLKYRKMFTKDKCKNYILPPRSPHITLLSYPESVATPPPFSPIEGQKWFDQISSQ
jgi:hypothetical protein